MNTNNIPVPTSIEYLSMV